MKKRLWILLGAVVAIVVGHAFIIRQCAPVKVTVMQTTITDTVFVRDSLRYTPRQPFRKIEINGADSVALVKIYGIGPVLSHRILTYRRQLGGFYALAQLLEIKGINPQVIKNFVVDSTKIQKININFATRKELAAHPYITPSMAARIEKGKMKGGYLNNYLELTSKNILLPKEARRVAPYLSFINN